MVVTALTCAARRTSTTRPASTTRATRTTAPADGERPDGEQALRATTGAASAPRCPHTRTTTAGSNQYYRRIKCLDCGTLLDQWRTRTPYVTEAGGTTASASGSVAKTAAAVSETAAVPEAVPIPKATLLPKAAPVPKADPKAAPAPKAATLPKAAASSKAAAKSSTAAAWMCPHARTTRKGSNQYKLRVKCLDCGHIEITDRRTSASDDDI